MRVLEGVDVGSDESVARLATEVDAERVDLLLSNAGVNRYSRGYADADTERMLQEYNVNALGAVRLVRTLLPKLGAGSKIALVSTGAGAAVPGGAGAGGDHYGYRMSKGGLNVLGATLGHDLRPLGIAVVLLNPGSLDTKHMRDAMAASKTARAWPMIPPEEAAPGVLAQIDALTLETSGRWVDRFGEPVTG